MANINIFTRCTIRNQLDILKTAVVNVSKSKVALFTLGNSKGQKDISHKGELQTLTKQLSGNNVLAI